MNKSNPNPKKLSEHLEAQFNQMAKGTAAPSELQTEVFNTLDTIGLIGDVADLFTVKFTFSEAAVIDAAMGNFEDETEESEIEE